VNLWKGDDVVDAPDPYSLFRHIENDTRLFILGDGPGAGLSHLGEADRPITSHTRHNDPHGARAATDSNCHNPSAHRVGR